MAGKKGVGASAPTQINVVNAEALKVGPDEVLILRFRDDALVSDDLIGQFLDELDRIGIGDRALIVQGDIEWAVVESDG